MELITRQSLANRAANKFRNAYGKGQYGQNWLAVCDKLDALGNNPNPDDVDAAIGNCSWTNQRCDECKRRSYPIVRLGEEPDYESRTANVCIGCLQKALVLASSAIPQE